MSRAAAVSRAQLTRALQAMQAAGTPARGLLCLPDGSTALLTDAPDTPLASNDGGDWMDLVGDEAKARRAQGA